MIILCEVLCNKHEDLEENEYLKELGVQEQPVEDYWIPRYVDLGHAVTLFAYSPVDGNEETQGFGNLCVDIDNSGSVIVTNIPFDTFEPFIHKKNADMVMQYGDNGLVLIG